ncbi:polysaccharide deacetylase family protein [Parahaliea mediterranea]|uniref:polysaccharide deacetylase family protein n=1 Tax=Parahaliea mediterranea TaxID=651086 RepID=UPI000E2FB1F4|nr:polysaccharide deacetylase family protein [Parahaliea mediterranea]
MMTSATSVAITFDIEFDINGAFTHPALRAPKGAITLLGHPGNHPPTGLSHILDTLERHNVRATFFIETLNTCWFGLEEMGAVAHRIAGRGHELQLHLHPAWLQFEHPNWAELAREDPPRSDIHDNLASRSTEQAADIIRHGLSVFKDWGLPAPSAVRTGNLMIEPHLYPAFYACGLRLSSSIGLGHQTPQSQSLHRYHAALNREGVIELPVSSYQGSDYLLRPKTRLATLIGMGLDEQAALLEAAQRQSTPFLVLLSHVCEFHHSTNDGAYRRNRLTELKFERLCQQLCSTPDLNAVTIGELAAQVDDITNEVPLRVPPWRSARRLLDRATHIR